MRVYFWGTRGSLPASISSDIIETKLLAAIRLSQAYPLENDEAVKEFIHTRLPFTIRNTYGGNASCVEIRGPEEYVLCDAGTGLRDFGQAYLKKKTTAREELPKEATP